MKDIHQFATTANTWKNSATRALGVLVITLVALGVFGRTLQYDMIFDDDASIIGNESIHQLTPLFGESDSYGPLKPQPGTPVSARPLVSLTLAINYHFSQIDPVGYRICHICAHILVALILWSVVAKTLSRECFQGRFARSRNLLGFLAAMVWLVHPTNTETVVYLSQRTELQMGLFYALTMYLSIRFWDSTRWASRVFWCAAAVVSSVCGMLSKEMMASIPAMVFLYEWTFVGGSLPNILKRSWYLHLGLMASWIPLGFIYAMGEGTPLAGFNNTISAYDFWLTQSNTFFIYWRLLVFPFPLLLHYHVTTLSSVSEAWPGVLAMSFYLMATAICVLRRMPVGYSLLWFFTILSPTLIVPLPHEEISERRLYVTLLGVIPYIVVAIFVTIRKLANFSASKAPKQSDVSVVQSHDAWGLVLTSALISAITIAFMFICVVTLPRLQYQKEIWSYVLKYQPGNTFAMSAHGIIECNYGNEAQGLEKIKAAYASDPNYEFFITKLIQAYDLTHDYQSMLPLCQKLYELNPRHPPHVYALAVAFEKNGMYSDAMTKYRETIELLPKSWEAHSALATLLAEHNKVDESLKHFEIATKVHPDFLNCMNLINLYMNTRQEEKALGVGKLLLEAARKEKSTEEVAQIQRSLDELEQFVKASQVPPTIPSESATN